MKDEIQPASGMTFSAILARALPASRRINLLAMTCAPGMTSGTRGAIFLAVAATSPGLNAGMVLITDVGKLSVSPSWTSCGTQGER